MLIFLASYLISSSLALVIRNPFEVKAVLGDALCDPQWHYYAQTQSCYFVGDKQTFDLAQAVCTSIGGNLTSVTNVFENNYIVSLTTTGENQSDNGMTWIGFHIVNNNWVWIDGTPVQYQNWEKHYPENDRINKCAMLMQDNHSFDRNSKDLWRNEKCGATMRKFVCKKPSNYVQSV